VEVWEAEGVGCYVPAGGEGFSEEVEGMRERKGKREEGRGKREEGRGESVPRSKP
jgi:hypothetical protein